MDVVLQVVKHVDNKADSLNHSDRLSKTWENITLKSQDDCHWANICGETSGRYQEAFSLGDMQPVFPLLVHDALPVGLTLAKTTHAQNAFMILMPGRSHECLAHVYEANTKVRELGSLEQPTCSGAWAASDLRLGAGAGGMWVQGGEGPARPGPVIGAP